MSEEEKKKSIKEESLASEDETNVGGVKDVGEEGYQTKEPPDPEDGTGEGKTPSPEGDLEEMLKNQYGDYMTLPPEEKRKTHYPYKLSFSDGAQEPGV